MIWKSGLIITLIAAPMPESLGEGGSTIGTVIGLRNLYRWELSRGLDLVEYSEKYLR